MNLMAHELKIRVHDHRQVEATLVSHGAIFSEERKIVDTYFNQPVPQEVLKIQQDERGHWLINLKPRDGKFDIVKFEQISDTASLHAELEQKFGIMSILTKRCRFFDWGEYSLDLNLIEQFGDFLVLTGPAPTIDMLHQFGIETSERITVPFNELPRIPHPIG